MPSRTMTVSETARVLGIGRSSAYEAVRRGEIPALKFGRSVRISRQVVEELLKGGNTGNVQTPETSEPQG